MYIRKLLLDIKKLISPLLVKLGNINLATFNNSSRAYVPSYSQTQSLSVNRRRGYMSKLMFGNIKNNINKIYRNPIFWPFVIVAIVVIVIGYIMVANIARTRFAGGDPRIIIEKPKATQALSKQFSFLLKDAQGKEISKFKYEIQGAELRDVIVIKGQKATAVNGRTFLVINLKITNDFDKTIQIKSRDYIRLIVAKSKEKLAPDIHNDPVEIQAISTKYTRLGFPINDTDGDLTLQVGEITGGKEKVKLDLK